MLIAVDWGTSHLRAWLMDARGSVVSQREAALGISQLAADSFATTWAAFAGDWLRAHPKAVTLMCGMVGSRQGWREAPYLPCPAGVCDLAGSLMLLPQANERTWLVPGLKVRLERHIPDVMRGEETLAVGCALGLATQADTPLLAYRLLMPGTHSKWIEWVDGQILRFATYMTGEVFGLLQQHSLLGRMLPAGETDELQADAFDEGVIRAVESSNSVLHHLFAVRTLALFDELPSEERRSYLSGLLIGEELRYQLPALQAERASRADRPIVLAANAALTQRYQRALALFGIQCQFAAPQACADGLWAMAQQAELM